MQFGHDGYAISLTSNRQNTGITANSQTQCHRIYKCRKFYKMTVMERLHLVNIAPTPSSVSKYLTIAFGALSSWNDARMTRNALLKLSARQLEDIGLVPGDIDRISRRQAL